MLVLLLLLLLLLGLGLLVENADGHALIAGLARIVGRRLSGSVSASPSGTTAAAAPAADETCGNAETGAAANAGETTTGATAETSHRRGAPQPATAAHGAGPSRRRRRYRASGRNLALATPPSLFVFEGYPSNITAFVNSLFFF